jgi:hypothetical protein
MFTLNLPIAAKIRWRMVYDHNPLYTILQDKLAVKKLAAQHGIPSAEVLFETGQPENIPFEQLPEKCFIKANHGCNWNILKYGDFYYNFVNGEELISPEGFYLIDHSSVRSLTPDEVREICKQWLHERYRPIEWAYNNIRPVIFGEQIIEPHPEKETMDYRCYTFRGRVATISLGSPSMRKKKENIFFDQYWNKIVLENNFETEPSKIPEKPLFLDELLDAAQKIAENKDFLRIDFFVDHSRCYLSEVTIYPNGGQDNRPTSDQHFNLFLGNQWKMRFFPWLRAWNLELKHRKSMQ